MEGDVRLTADAEARDLEQLARRYAHRVGFFADRIQRRFRLDACWRDDLVSAGYWGLFKALRNRRVEAEALELSAYVSMRVEGAVFDEARRCMRRGGYARPHSAEAHGGETRDGPSADELLRQPGDEPDRLADRARCWERVARAIGPLEPLERRVLRAYAEGASVAEIARAEGVPLGTMHQRVLRISRRLRAREPQLRALLGGRTSP